jgi:hypothetical protein
MSEHTDLVEGIKRAIHPDAPMALFRGTECDHERRSYGGTNLLTVSISCLDCAIAGHHGRMMDRVEEDQR